MSSLRVPHAAASASLVRHRMLSELRAGPPGHVALSPELLETAALVVSELVGNAVRHGQALPSGGLLASWARVSEGLRLEVVDGGAGPTGTRAAADPDAECGRGLQLVEALVSRWGSSAAAGGTAVWAELAAPAGPAARP